jgi:hypothetical protein
MTVYLKKTSPNYGTNALRHDVENGFDQTNFSTNQKASCHSWVDVAPTDMSDGLGHCSHSNTKTQCDTDKITCKQIDNGV